MSCLCVCVVSLVGHCVWTLFLCPFWSYQRALVHSRVTTFVLCLQEEEHREAVAVAREEEERAKELQKLARLQVKQSSFPDSPEQGHSLKSINGTVLSPHRIRRQWLLQPSERTGRPHTSLRESVFIMVDPVTDPFTVRSYVLCFSVSS